MNKDYEQDPEFQDFIEEARQELVPKLEDSSIAMSLWEGRTDPKFAMELGLMITLDKPIILVVKPGASVPNKLAMVADEIVEADMTPGSAERDSVAITTAIKRLQESMADE